MYEEFNELLEEVSQMRKDDKIREYVLKIQILEKMKEDIKEWIKNWTLECREHDYYTTSISKRASYDVDSIIELLWEQSEDYIKKTIDWTKLKKDIESWKVLLEYDLKDICSFTNIVTMKCPLLS